MWIRVQWPRVQLHRTYFITNNNIESANTFVSCCMLACHRGETIIRASQNREAEFGDLWITLDVAICSPFLNQFILCPLWNHDEAAMVYSMRKIMYSPWFLFFIKVLTKFNSNLRLASSLNKDISTASVVFAWCSCEA